MEMVVQEQDGITRVNLAGKLDAKGADSIDTRFIATTKLQANSAEIVENANGWRWAHIVNLSRNTSVALVYTSSRSTTRPVFRGRLYDIHSVLLY